MLKKDGLGKSYHNCSFLRVARLKFPPSMHDFGYILFHNPTMLPHPTHACNYELAVFSIVYLAWDALLLLENQSPVLYITYLILNTVTHLVI